MIPPPTVIVTLHNDRVTWQQSNLLLPITYEYIVNSPHIDSQLTVQRDKYPLTFLPSNASPMHPGWPSAGSNPIGDTTTVKGSVN